MNVAVCLSGHLRSYQTSWPKFRSQLKGADSVDVFLHTWNVGEYRKAGQGEEKPQTTPVDHADVWRVFGEELCVLSVDSWAKASQSRAHNMFRKMRQCDRIRRDVETYVNLVPYDLVIRARPDGVFTGDVDLRSFTLPGVFVPNGDDFLGVNDRCCLGSSDVMSKVCSVGLKSDDTAPDQQNISPEAFWKHHLERLGFPVRRMPVSYVV